MFPSGPTDPPIPFWIIIIIVICVVILVIVLVVIGVVVAMCVVRAVKKKRTLKETPVMLSSKEQASKEYSADEGMHSLWDVKDRGKRVCACTTDAPTTLDMVNRYSSLTKSKK